MRIVQITEDKVGKMTECLEKMLHYGGRLMSCLEEMEAGNYGERSYGHRDAGEREFGGGNYGERDFADRGYNERTGYRDPVWEDPEMRMASRYGERRTRDSRGRFT